MKKITLGREGNQPFSITQPGVSRQHAEIEITDDGVWVLKDLDPENSNGTFIRDENGELQRISTINISGKTFICLGPDNSNGCSFYAEQVINPGKFTQEFEYLNKIEDNFDEKLEKVDIEVKRQKWTILIANILVVVVSFLPCISGNLRLDILRIVPILSALFGVFYDGNSQKRKIMKQREKFHRCPNPKCSHTLRSAEIRDMQCAKCKCK